MKNVKQGPVSGKRKNGQEKEQEKAGVFRETGGAGAAGADPRQGVDIARLLESESAAEEFREWMRGQARAALCAVVAEEVRVLCGPSYRPWSGARSGGAGEPGGDACAGADGSSSTCYRAGSAPSSVFVDGRRESMRRPRVRRREETDDGEYTEREVTLQSWKLAQDPEEWEEAMMRAILCGVSTRDMARLRPEELRGESKSSLSRLWQRKAGELAREMAEADLSGFDLLVLMLDAVVLADGLVVTVALGIDGQGNKRVLGYRIGSSENREVCRDLLADLTRRGLATPSDRRLLAVLDGSKALRQALLEFFPDAPVQRCLVHKERNVRGYLARKHWARLAQLFTALRRAQGPEAGREAAEAIAEFLSDKNAQARESFEEAGEDLLALHRLNTPNTLAVSLLSTNCIENAFKNLRRHIGRVCRWRAETDQADRWLASGLILAQEGFRKIRGHKDLPALAEALQRKDQDQNQSRPER